MFILITQTGPTTGSISGEVTTIGSIAQTTTLGSIAQASTTGSVGQASTTQSPIVEGKNRQTINLQGS